MSWVLFGLLAWTLGLVLVHALFCSFLFLLLGMGMGLGALTAVFAALGALMFYFFTGFAGQVFILAAICTGISHFAKRWWLIYALFPTTALMAYASTFEITVDRWMAEILSIHPPFGWVLATAALAACWVMMKVAAPYGLFGPTSPRHCDRELAWREAVSSCREAIGDRFPPRGARGRKRPLPPHPDRATP